MLIMIGGKKFAEVHYNLEEDFENDIFKQPQMFFGHKSILIPEKKKVGTKSLGGAIPDGYLIDLADSGSPEFYIIEVELAKHGFFEHIFPQVTKYFAFFKSNDKRRELVEKIYTTILADPGLKQSFEREIGTKEIHKFLSDIVEESQNILLIIDGEKEEVPETMATYTDTWAKIVSLMIVKKYSNDGSEAFSVDPAFEQMRISDIETLPEPTEEVIYSEDYHLENVENHVKEIYFKIRNELQELDQNLVINPTKYYISLGTKVGTKSEYICVVQFRKKKIRIVVFSKEQEVRGEVKHHVVVHLGETTQRFWNHESCEIIVDNEENIDEVISVLRALLRQAMKKTSV